MPGPVLFCRFRLRLPPAPQPITAPANRGRTPVWAGQACAPARPIQGPGHLAALQHEARFRITPRPPTNAVVKPHVRRPSPDCVPHAHNRSRKTDETEEFRGQARERPGVGPSEKHQDTMTPHLPEARPCPAGRPESHCALRGLPTGRTALHKARPATLFPHKCVPRGKPLHPPHGLCMFDLVPGTAPVIHHSSQGFTDLCQKGGL